MAEDKSSKERQCPHCGARVAQKAKTCLMCGASLERKRHLSSIPILDILLLLGIVGLVALWLAKPWQEVELGALSLAPSFTSTPVTEAMAISTVVSSPTSTPTLPPTPIIAPTTIPIVHAVASGENLTSIAARYGTTVEAIAAANNIDPEQLLQVGQELIIPSIGATGGAEPLTATPEVLTYVVQPGDSLYSICVQYGASAEVIMAANDISDPNLIKADQELIIPLGTPTPVPTSTSTPTFTPTPGPPHKAPIPLHPPDDKFFHGTEEPILFAWTSVGILGDDEYYLVRLRHMMDDEVTTEWSERVEETSWRVPSEICPPLEARSHLFCWDVTVMRRTGEEGEGEPLSPISEPRRFYWY